MADPTIGGFTSEINALTSAMKQMRSEMSKLSGGGGGSSMMPNYAATASTNLFYTGNEGQGGFNAMGAAGGGLTAKLAGTKMGAGLSKLLTGGGATLAAAGFATSLMPGMEKYLVRETGYYQAGVSSMGALGMAALKSSTMSGIGTLTAVGSDATVAAILAGRGMTASMDKTSTYQQTLRGIGNAAKYMNQSNEVAAQSMEALTSGATSSSLLSRGIFTSDPTRKGAPALKESQIFEQFWQRWITDKSITKSEMQDEIRRGFIGANIDSLDIDPAAKERLKVFLVAHSRDDTTGAQGVIMDITDADSMSKAFEGTSALATGGYTNPMSSAYQISTQETAYVDKFATDYKQGFADAADSIKSLQDAVAGTTAATGLFGSELKQLAAFMSTFMGSDIGAGFTSGGFVGMTAGLAVTAATTGINNIMNGLNGTGSNIGGGSGSSNGDPGGLWGPVVPSGVSNVSADFGDKGSQWAAGEHYGVDFAVPERTPVYAAYAGQVQSVGSGSGNYSYGNHVIIDHGDGWTSLYAHMSQITVTEKQKVAAGTQLGFSGSTGNVTGPHLHFEVRKNGKPVNPNTFTSPPSNGTGGGGGSLSSPVAGASVSGTGFSPVVGSSSMQIASVGSAYSASSMASTGISGSGTSVGGNNVTINVTIAQASDAEALRLADMVKAQLQQDSFMSSMGAY